MSVFSDSAGAPRRAVRAAGSGMLALLAASCMFMGDSRDPIPYEKVPAPQAAPAHPLIVMLPGLEDDASVVQKHGVDSAIQRAWPTADLIITATTYPYYRDGRLVKHLRREIMEPARKAGYREIWLAGGSMGGLGALMYEHEYPGEVAGIVLLSPYLGGSFLINEIKAAGGVHEWHPGDLPKRLTADDYKRQVWAMVKDWSESRRRTQRVWLICGESDQMLPGARLLGATLPPRHYIERPGKHDWDFWPSAAEEIFRDVRRQEQEIPGQPRPVVTGAMAGAGASTRQ